MFSTLFSKVKKFGKRALAIAPGIVPGLAGLALVSLGIALIYLPAGLIVGGLALIWLDSRI